MKLEEPSWGISVGDSSPRRCWEQSEAPRILGASENTHDHYMPREHATATCSTCVSIHYARTPRKDTEIRNATSCLFFFFLLKEGERKEGYGDSQCDLMRVGAPAEARRCLVAGEACSNLASSGERRPPVPSREPRVPWPHGISSAHLASSAHPAHLASFLLLLVHCVSSE